MNVADASGIIWGGLLDVFGSSVIVILIGLGFLAFLCLSARLTIEEAGIVFLPALFGLVMDGLLQIWIKALMVMAIGMLWGLALIRLAR